MLALLLLILIGAVLWIATPERAIVRRIEWFVENHGERLAEAIESDAGIPAIIGIRTWNEWNGEQEMTEFILGSNDKNFYGCYYSPDDVPCAFQNMHVMLVQEKNGMWIWKDEDNHHGSTWRIRPKWYGFTASFLSHEVAK